MVVVGCELESVRVALATERESHASHGARDDAMLNACQRTMLYSRSFAKCLHHFIWGHCPGYGSCAVPKHAIVWGTRDESNVAWSKTML